ncbi:MAG: hypothetical protein V9F03_00685 [Microthrixaceae bacterium]
MRMTNINQEASATAEQFGVHLEPELHVTSVPRGRSAGLFVALAGAVCSIDRARPLPVITIDELGRGDCMFDYDPAEAIDLDVALG